MPACGADTHRLQPWEEAKPRQLSHQAPRAALRLWRLNKRCASAAGSRCFGEGLGMSARKLPTFRQRAVLFRRIRGVAACDLQQLGRAAEGSLRITSHHAPDQQILGDVFFAIAQLPFQPGFSLVRLRRHHACSVLLPGLFGPSARPLSRPLAYRDTIQQSRQHSLVGPRIALRRANTSVRCWQVGQRPAPIATRPRRRIRVWRRWTGSGEWFIDASPSCICSGLSCHRQDMGSVARERRVLPNALSPATSCERVAVPLARRD